MTNGTPMKMPNFCDRHHPYRYETALNMLMQMGISLDRLNLIAIGRHKNYLGEIIGQEPQAGEVIKKDTTIILEVGFSSAVDVMPFQFFYGLQSKVSGGKWEDNARNLLAPFDGAVIRHNAITRFLILKYSLAILDNEYVNAFLDLFDFELIDRLDLNEAAVWARLLPSFNDWGGNADKVARILKLLFGYRFTIIENLPGEYEIREDLRYKLGSKAGRLGRETIIGRRFAECDSTYAVVIRDITRKEALAFLPGKPLRKKLDTFLSIAMPNNLDYRIRFRIIDREASLGAGQEGSRLGMTTHLTAA